MRQNDVVSICIGVQLASSRVDGIILLVAIGQILLIFDNPTEVDTLSLIRAGHQFIRIATSAILLAMQSLQRMIQSMLLE